MPIHTDYSTCMQRWMWRWMVPRGNHQWEHQNEEHLGRSACGRLILSGGGVDSGYWEWVLPGEWHFCWHWMVGDSPVSPEEDKLPLQSAQGWGAVLLWVSFPVSGAKTADLLGVCPEQMLCRFVFLCRRQEIWMNRRLSGTFNVMIF